MFYLANVYRMVWWFCVLDLGHGSNVTRLHVILELCNLFLELVNGHLLILNHAHKLDLKKEGYK